MKQSLLRGSARLYDFCLRFYPRSFNQEFGEEMSFVFSESLHDACARQGNREIAGFWARTVLDVGKSLVIEHIEDYKERNMTNPNSTNNLLKSSIARVAVATAGLLLIPLAASLWLDTFNWGLLDFVVTAAILFVAGLSFDLITRRSGSVIYRAAFFVAIGTAAFLFFSNLAVGVIGSEDEPANLMYPAVIAVAVIGAILARFRPAGMARAMFAAALAQASTIAIALLLGMQYLPGVTVPELFMVNGFFMTGWIAAGLLFRRAGAENYKLQSSATV